MNMTVHIVEPARDARRKEEQYMIRRRTPVSGPMRQRARSIKMDPSPQLLETLLSFERIVKMASKRVDVVGGTPLAGRSH